MGESSPTVGVIGLGLIGGSLARGLTAGPLAGAVVGHDADAATRRAAAAEGIIVAEDAEDLARRCDVVVVAVPPEATAELVGRLLGADPDVVVTDVASVKAPLVRSVERIAGRHLDRYLPAHPLAGSEASGWEAASAELLHESLWAICPASDRTTSASLLLVTSVVDRLGGRMIFCDASDHDDAVARTSHVPHVVAQAVAGLVCDDDRGRLRAALSGGGYRDMTRIVRSDPRMWNEILKMNRTASLEGLDEVIATLESLREAVRHDDADAVARAWREGASARDSVDAVRWKAPRWSQHTGPWPAWDRLLGLGRNGVSVRKLRTAGPDLIAFEASDGPA